MESSPPPYQPEEHEHLTQEQRKAIEVSLQPEALAAERNAQMNLLNGLMDASGEITIKPKVKTASQAAEVTVSTPAGDGSKNEESASKVEPESIQPAKKKARLALLERSKQLAQQNAKSDAWQPNQRYVPPTEVSQTTTADADASSSSEGESESESEEKPSSKGQGDGVKMSQLTEMFKPHEAEGEIRS